MLSNVILAATRHARKWSRSWSPPESWLGKLRCAPRHLCGDHVPCVVQYRPSAGGSKPPRRSAQPFQVAGYVCARGRAHTTQVLGVENAHERGVEAPIGGGPSTTRNLRCPRFARHPLDDGGHEFFAMAVAAAVLPQVVLSERPDADAGHGPVVGPAELPAASRSHCWKSTTGAARAPASSPQRQREEKPRTWSPSSNVRPIHTLKYCSVPMNHSILLFCYFVYSKV